MIIQKSSDQNKNDTSQLDSKGGRVSYLLKLTQTNKVNLESILQVSRITLRRWEKGIGLTRSNAERLAALCKEAFNIAVTPTWIIFGSGDKPYKLLDTHFDSKKITDLIPSIEKEIQLFLAHNDKAIIKKIDNINFFPFFDYASIVGGICQPTETFIGEKLCIIAENSQNNIFFVKKAENSSDIQFYEIQTNNHKINLKRLKGFKCKEIAPITRYWKH